MGRGKIGLIRLWGLVLFTLLYLTHQTTSSEDQNKTCNPSHCGIITNIRHPSRLRHDPPNCGDPMYELACEKTVTLVNLHSGTYQVLGINYENYTIRLKDPEIREGDCSTLPRYSLSRSNFSDTYGPVDYDSNPYFAFNGRSELTFEHVIYLKCSDPVRDDEAGYVDTAPCAVDWGSRGSREGGGHVYAVAGRDLEAGRLKTECRVKSVATIASNWSSSIIMKRKSYSYADIHRGLSHGFEISWWIQACVDLRCKDDEYCSFDNDMLQKFFCTKIELLVRFQRIILWGTLHALSH